MVFGAQVNIALFGSNSMPGNKNPFNEREGVLLQDVTVFERAHLALIGIADNVFNIAGRGAVAFPLDAAGKAGPTPTPQPGSLKLTGYLLRGHFTAGFGQRLETTAFQVAVNSLRVDYIAVFKHHSLLRHELASSVTGTIPKFVLSSPGSGQGEGPD